MSAESFPTRHALLRRGRTLEYATVGYNVLEGVIAIGSGLLASSIALVGFGIDSGIEVLSGLILLWRLDTRRDEEERERVEARALKLVGWSFLILAAYVAFDAVMSLVRREAPDESRVGIALAAVSVIVMPLLVRAKRRVAAQLNSRAWPPTRSRRSSARGSLPFCSPDSRSTPSPAGGGPIPSRR